MALFHPDNKTRTERHKRLAAYYEFTCTVVDFLAAAMFFIGSILFFSSAWETVAIWFFVIGSLFFALSPTIKLMREFHFLRIGDIDDLAERSGLG